MARDSLPLPSETVGEAGVGQVSWLEAALLAFPGVVTPSGMENKRSETCSDLLQWRGRAGFTPASVLTHPPIQL